MRKIANKFTSAVLVLALCISALCGALIPANAAAAGNTYTIVGDAVAASTKTVTMEVTLTSATGLTSGSFDLMFGGEVIDNVNFDSVTYDSNGNEVGYGNYVTPTNETVEEFRARDKDGNNMINGTNVYTQVEEPIYDEDGNPTGETEWVTKLTSVTKENDGNKGTLLPNAYDNTVGLYDTKIEITGGTLANGTVVDTDTVNSYFTNSEYNQLEGTTTNAITGEAGDGRQFAYNMTDNYKTANSSKYTTTVITETAADGTQTTKTVYELSEGLLDKYYREYTTVDVATANLGYSISTVSEDTFGQTHSYSQYAQGFKDITFNASEAFSSITFTVTFDFSGTCDRISANNGADADKLIGTTTVDGNTVTYKNNDGRWVTENYVQYGKKYQLNFVSDDATLSGYSEAPLTTDFFHVHNGTITEEVGTADPVNKAAIDALLAENPQAVEGVDYFELYDAKCEYCGQITPMIAAPDLPYKVKNESGNMVLANGTKGAFSFNNFRNISGVSLNYNNDGTVALNIHYPSSMDGEQLLVTDENGIVLDCSDTLEVADDRTSVFTAAASNFAGYKADIKVSRYTGPLMSSSQMVTIDNLSAREVDQTLYIARYTPSSSTETQLMGITHAISIANYCSEVIKGDNVYYLKDDNYSETKAEQDKAVAAAFINYAVASKNALAIKTNDYVERITDTLEYTQVEGSTSQWYDDRLIDPDDGSGDGSSWDEAIIIDSAEELVYLAKGAGDKTAGKYYKVADNIEAFYLSSGLDVTKSLADNLDILKSSGKNHSSSAKFQGNFDGNGVTVYGVWFNPTEGSVAEYAGLFPTTSGNVTVKNVNVSHSYLVGKTSVGGIIGYYYSDGTTTLTVENCSVTDSYLENVDGTGSTDVIGSLVGYARNFSSSNGPIIINNCFVNLDEQYYISADEHTDAVATSAVHGGLVGNAQTNAVKFTNCISIGVKPYSVWNGSTTAPHSANAINFSNCYTDQSIDDGFAWSAQTYASNQIAKLTTEQLTGEAAATNMSSLNWETVWYTTESYPALYAPYNVPEIERTIYWDGSSTKTAPTEGSGTKEDPYIINTVAELAYISGQTKANYTITDGKYYKIADGIKNIVMQPENYAADIMALGSAAETKAYFEKNAANMKSWFNYGWEGSTFCGDIDFNGATVYGIYQVSSNNAGLFSNIDAGAVFRNLTIKNSYMKSMSSAANYQVGAIGAVSNAKGHGKDVNGIIWAQNCTIANNYLYGNAAAGTLENGGNSRSGVMFGALSDTVYVDNCLIYGNDATYGDGAIMPLYSGAGNAIPETAETPDGLVTKIDVNGGNLHFNMVRNSIILGALPYDITQQNGSRFNDAGCYENVYTDQPAGTITFPGTASSSYNPVLTFATAQIKHIEIDDIYGSGAVVEMPNLDWYDAITNPDGVWYFGYNTALPSLSKIENTMLPALQSSYDAVSFTTPDTNGDGTEYNGPNGTMSFGVYATALSLKANPYMSFAFAFHGDYKTNRDKIQVRFTYTVNGTEYVYGDDAEEQVAIAIPTYVEGQEIRNVNGWTNTKSAGRYHTFKASFIPVEAMVNGIKIEANYNDNGWVDLGTFSVDGIGGEFEAEYTATPCDYYATRVEAAKAFKFYVQQVNARYGTIQ